MKVIIDGQYSIEHKQVGRGKFLVLHTKNDRVDPELVLLSEQGENVDPEFSVWAMYDNETSLLKDLVSHSINRNPGLTLDAYLGEADRIARLCIDAFSDLRIQA